MSLWSPESRNDHSLKTIPQFLTLVSFRGRFGILLFNRLLVKADALPSSKIAIIRAQNDSPPLIMLDPKGVGRQSFFLHDRNGNRVEN
jgi:hypothetical protein